MKRNMNWEREDHPDQLSMVSILEAPTQKVQTNAERQAAFRERQRQLGRCKTIQHLTIDERDMLLNVLNCIRLYDEVPAMMRSRKSGQVRPVEEF